MGDMFRAFLPGASLYDLRSACPPLPYPWGRILESPTNWGFFFASSNRSLISLRLPQSVVETLWIPSLTDTQLLPSFEALIAFDVFSFCLGGLIAGIHGHFFDSSLYGNQVKRRLLKTPREIMWRSIIIPDVSFNFFEGPTYKVIRFIGRCVMGGSIYLGIRWLTHSLIPHESLTASWISSLVFMNVIGRKYSEWTFGETMLISLWIGLGATCMEEVYSNSLHLINK